MTSDICPLCKGTSWFLDENTGGYKRCKCYEKDRIQRLWKKYGVDPKDVKKLNDYKPIDEQQKIVKNKAINYITNFQSINESGLNNFAILGQPGSGKTHILLSIGAALIEKGIEVVYMPYVEVMRELKATTMDNEYYLKLSSRYQQAKVLIIDDLFKDKLRNGNIVGDLNSSDIKHIYPILNYRYSNSLPILVSSEGIPDILKKIDDAQAGRIIERCNNNLSNNLTVFIGDKYNYRFKAYTK